MSETNCTNEIAGVALEIQHTDKNTMKSPTNNNYNAGKENQMCDQMENKQQANCEQFDKSKLSVIVDKSVTVSNVSKMEKEAMEEIRPQRICLVGAVIENEAVVLAAQKFNVPIVASVSGAEFIDDTECITYFVMQKFEGEEYEQIRKTQHRIYGPPALQQMARLGSELKYLRKPTYNFAMEGIITCFTGIRKKDELTLLVDLIHKMGGSIRKDLNSKSTHLICNSSSGEKYRYAMTFRLTVVHSEWVHAAWEQRDNLDFLATDDEFTRNHRVKRFEGQRVCFFGFSAEEHQEMVDILKSNGGIPVDLDDPTCSHVILANNVDHFPEELAGPPTSPPPLTAITPNLMNASTAATPSIHVINADKCLPPDGLDKLNLNDKVVHKVKQSGSSHTIVDTPKKKLNCGNSDGIVLPGNEGNQFLEPTNLSPILHNIEEEEENADDANDKEMSKRKRDSFDNISIISTDTFAAQFNSAKKPKLIRTGSITRSLRRSMSFVALKNPMNMIRTRRNSIDPNSSINSITSMNESTFSESIKRPVKEKLQSLKDRLTHGNRSKREFCLTPKTTRKLNNQIMPTIEHDDNHFVPPNEISMLSCRKILNSTMNTTEAIEVAESDEQSQLATVNGPNASSNVNKLMDNNQDVADSTVNCTTVQNHVIPPLAERKTDSRTHIVKSDWFWFTIQDGYANEEEYLFCDYLDSIANTPGGDRRDSLPTGVKQRKRKRFSIMGASGKRRSSISDAGLSVSGSFLDCTGSPIINRDTNGKSFSVSAFSLCSGTNLLSSFLMHQKFQIIPFHRDRPQYRWNTKNQGTKIDALQSFHGFIWHRIKLRWYITYNSVIVSKTIGRYGRHQ